MTIQTKLYENGATIYTQLNEARAALLKFTQFIFWAALVLCGLYFGVGYGLFYLAPSTSLGYALVYYTDPGQVSVQPQPHDCEWGSAPLGDKNCHHKAVVESIRTDVSPDGVTQLVSWDEGKTWYPNTSNLKQAVNVSWAKVED